MECICRVYKKDKDRREEIKARGMKDGRKKGKERKRRVFLFGVFFGGGNILYLVHS